MECDPLGSDPEAPKVNAKYSHVYVQYRLHEFFEDVIHWLSDRVQICKAQWKVFLEGESLMLSVV
jgi:hypothetical protein